MVTLVGIAVVFVTHRISLRYPEASVAVWIAFCVSLASIVAQWGAR